LAREDEAVPRLQDASAIVEGLGRKWPLVSNRGLVPRVGISGVDGGSAPNGGDFKGAAVSARWSWAPVAAG
jgi:hypothetical protein